MRIDTSGRVLIGANTSYANADADNLQVGNNNSSTPSGITLGSTANSSIRFSDAGNANDGYMLYNHADTSLRFGANNAERVRIDSNGFLLVGKTSATSTNLGVEVRTSQLVIGKTASGTENGIYFTHGTSYVGGLNYSDSATSLVTSSDERLKKNIKDADDAGNKIDAIKVRKFDWEKTW